MNTNKLNFKVIALVLSAVFVLLSFNCRNSMYKFQRQGQESCSTLKRFAKKNWKPKFSVEKCQYFSLKEEYREILLRDYRNCFLGAKKTDIVQLLGRPSESASDYILYHLDPACNERTSILGKYLIFYVKPQTDTIFEYNIEVQKIIE